MRHVRRYLLACGALSAIAAAAAAQTTGAITPEDLRKRLSAFADDSMLGRATGGRGYVKASEYIARELGALHIKPAGDKNTYFQNVPIDRARIDIDNASLSIGGPVALKPGVDFLPIVGHFGVPFAASSNPPIKQRLVFLESLSDLLSPEFAADIRSDSAVKDSILLLVVLRAPVRPDGRPDYQLWNAVARAEQYRSIGGRVSGLLVETLDLTPRSMIAQLAAPGWVLSDDPPPLGPVKKRMQSPAVAAITRSAANVLRVTPGGTADFRFRSELSGPGAPTRNVVGMIEGSDPLLRSEVVVLSAHADHLGIAGSAAREGRDSIMNGADVSGSGAVALLEVAEHLVSLNEKPRRTIVFLWTVGEEQGMLGSQWFLTHVDSAWLGTIVANINVDAIGRGGGADIEHGGPDYVQVIGATQLSDEFAHWVSKLTHDPQFGLRPDDEYDVTQPHKRASCSGDHWSFAQLGIPSLFITTGGHADTRTVSDAPGTIDYDKLTRVTRLVSALTLGVANRDDRPALDDPVLGPLALCGQ